MPFTNPIVVDSMLVAAVSDQQEHSELQTNHSISAAQVLAAQREAPLNHRTERKNWSDEEDSALKKGVSMFGERNWKAVAEMVNTRNHTQCMQRWSKALKPGLKKGHWTKDEDTVLREMARAYNNNWAKVVQHIHGRTVKQIRERWSNHVNPTINHSSFTESEDQIIVELHRKHGNKWALIAKSLQNRTAEGVKIRWKSLCRKTNQELKRKEQQRHHGERMQFYQPSTDQTPSLLRLSRHILVGLDTSGGNAAPESPLPQASPPKKARTLQISAPQPMNRQGRSMSVDSSNRQHQFRDNAARRSSDPAPYLPRPVSSFSFEDFMQEDTSMKCTTGTNPISAPSLERSKSESAACSTHSFVRNDVGYQNDALATALALTHPPTHSHSKTSVLDEEEAVNQFEEESDDDKELGFLLGQLEEIEAQQEEREHIQRQRQQQRLAGQVAQAAHTSTDLQLNPQLRAQLSRCPTINNSSFKAASSNNSSFNSVSSVSLKLTDSLRNLFLSDEDVADDCDMKVFEDRNNDDDEEEDVTVVVSESEVKSAQSLNNGHRIGGGIARGRANVRANCNASVDKPSNGNLLIRPPSFNNNNRGIFSNLTNSPQASSNSSIDSSPSLDRSLSNKSLLGMGSPKCSFTDNVLAAFCISPTAKDFELLSEHLEVDGAESPVATSTSPSLTTPTISI